MLNTIQTGRDDAGQLETSRTWRNAGERGRAVSEVNTDKLTFAFAVSETPLTADPLAKRGFGPRRPAVTVSALRVPGTSRADQFLQQLQVNPISNQLSAIRALR